MGDILWIRISTKMFDDEKIKLIDSMPERDTIFNIWIKLLVQAGKTNAAGYIFLNENVPYTEEMLSTIFNRPLNSLRLALQTLKNFGMIDISDNHLIRISNWEKHQNIDGMERIREQNRLRKQKQREREKNFILGIEQGTNWIEENSCHVTLRDGHTLEEEAEEDIEVDRDKSTTPAIEIEEDNDYIKFFNKNFHQITEFELKILQNFHSRGIKNAAITLALQEAIEANSKDVRYIKKILERWVKNNIFTVQDVINDRLRHEEEKNRKSNKRQTVTKVDNFNNFEQRTYNFEELEKKLLGWNK